MTLVPANHYELEGAVEGVVDIFGLSGEPVVSLTVNDHTVTEAELRGTPAGFEVTAQLAVTPDAGTTWLLLLLPRVNVEESAVRFTGVMVLATVRDSIGGPELVPGVLQHYDVRQVHGTASAVKAFADGGGRGYRG